MPLLSSIVELVGHDLSISMIISMESTEVSAQAW